MRFRLLIDEPGEGARNMAVDETLLLSALGASKTATLRFYGFHPPTVSFGYRQRIGDALDAEACRALGIDWVRRPTGGRALLHHHELTYSISAPFTGPFQGLSVRGVYDRVSEALRAALARLGVALDEKQTLGRRSPEPPLHVPCLAAPARHEITSGGRKIVASSQRRSSRAFLQHGSIFRSIDGSLWEKVRPKSVAPLPLSGVGIDQLVPEPVGRDRLVGAFRAAFEELLGPLDLSEGLTPAERTRLEGLVPKYRRQDSPDGPAG